MFRYILAFCVLTVLHTFAPAMAAVSASSGTSTRATISRVAPTENVVSDSGQSSSRTSSSRTNASRVVSGRGDTTTANRAVNARNVSGRSAADTRARTTTRAVAGRGTNTTARSTASRTSASSSRAAVSRAATTTASRAATTNAARSAKSSINRAAVTSKATVPSRTTSRATNARSRASISSALRIGARTTPTSTTQISEVDTGTATTGTSVSDMDELAQTTDFCKAQYMQCMDQFCNVLDDSQGRCSCSKNISNYAESEAILKAATEELRDVAQQVQYLGLSSDQVASLFTQTEGELQLSQSTDNSKINSSLNKLRDMIVEVKTGAPSSTSESTTSGLNFDMSGLLDFSFDSVGFDLGALFGNTKTNVASISNYRGEQLYKIATQRCKTAVLTSCQAQGVDTSIITNAYDLEIDKQCLVYERNLTEQNDEMVETIRNARNVLQRGRLMVAQRKNAYDLRECITELDACMQDDFVCGSDYENCLDPSGKYIVDGQVVVGTTPGVPGGGITASTSSVGGLYATWNYDSGNAWGNGRVAEYVDSYLDGKYPTSGLEYMANYLHNKIGYIEEGKAFGMCSGVLNQCQDYTFVDGEYAPDNQVIRQYLERTLVKIKSGQDSVLNDYAEDCLSDVSECLSENSYNSSSSTTTPNPSQIAINACKSVINSCRNITGFSTATDTAVNCWLDTAFNYTLVKDKSLCVEESVTQCNGRGEVLTSAGSCICDTGANFTGMAGACECKSGYKLSNNACVLDQQPVNPGNPNLSNQKVTINYNLNGATGGTVQSHQCNSGSACELSSLSKLGFGVYKAGYVFQGWSINQYATTGAYSINIASNPPSTTITVYAIWTPCVAGYFKPETSTAVALCTRCLSGTYSDTTGATSCKICDGTVGNNGTTCTPNTTGGGTVTLSYDLMGGTYTGGTLSTVTCDIDTSCALETNTNVYKAGYSLCGWSKTSNADCYDAEQRLTFSADDNGTTIYAIWSQCEAGTYSDASSNGCKSCTNKTYSNTVAATSCTACPSNAYTNADGNGCYCDSGYYKNGDEANEYATVYSGDTCSKPESGGESGSDTPPASSYGASMSTQRTIYDSTNEKYILIAKDTNTGICYATVEQDGTFSADLDSACIVDCNETSYSADVCDGAVTLWNEYAMAMAYSMRASNTFTFSFNGNKVDYFKLGLVNGKLPAQLYWLNSLLKYNNNGWELIRVYDEGGQTYYDKNGNGQIATLPPNNVLVMVFQEATNWGNICTSPDATNNIVSGSWDGEECSCPENSTRTDGRCYCNNDYQAASSGDTCESTDKIACDKLGSSVATWQDNKCVCTDSTKVFQNGTCGCDTAGNWTDNGNNSCVCKTDYYLVEGDCKSIESICSFEDFGIWDPYTNSCKDYEQSLQHRFMTAAACQDANGVLNTTDVVDGLDWCYCPIDSKDYTGTWDENGKCKKLETLYDIEGNEDKCKSVGGDHAELKQPDGRCGCQDGYYEYNKSCYDASAICAASGGTKLSDTSCEIGGVEYRLSTSGTCSAAGSVNSEELVVGTWCNCLSDDTYTGAWADNGTCATKNGQCDADKHLEFDSSTGTCVCMSGYYMHNSICLTPAQLCAYDEDDGSWTDMGTCEFNGYFLRHMDNASCQSITNAAVYEGRLIEDSNFKHDTWCYCVDGYQWATDSNTCIEKSFTEDDCTDVSGATWQDNQCVCTDNGKVFNGTACVCDEINGYVSDGGDGCQCASGYINRTDGELLCQTPDEVCKNDLHGSYENNTCKTNIDSGGIYVENAVLRYMASTTCSSIDAQAYPDASYGNWCYCGDGYQWNSENACELIKQPSGSDEALISACTTSDKSQNIVSGSWENSSCSCPDNSTRTATGHCQCNNGYYVDSQNASACVKQANATVIYYSNNGQNATFTETVSAKDTDKWVPKSFVDLDSANWRYPGHAAKWFSQYTDQEEQVIPVLKSGDTISLYLNWDACQGATYANTNTELTDGCVSCPANSTANSDNTACLCNEKDKWYKDGDTANAGAEVFKGDTCSNPLPDYQGLCESSDVSNGIVAGDWTGTSCACNEGSLLNSEDYHCHCKPEHYPYGAGTCITMAQYCSMGSYDTSTQTCTLEVADSQNGDHRYMGDVTTCPTNAQISTELDWRGTWCYCGGDYAWNANNECDRITVTVTYDTNGADSGVVAPTQCYKGSSSADQCKLDDGTNLFRKGYQFIGWGISSDSTVPLKFDKPTFTSDTTLYAIWTACAAGTYKDNEATGPQDCKPCTGNTYQTQTGQASCLACPENSVLDSVTTGCRCGGGYSKDGTEATKNELVFSTDTCKAIPEIPQCDADTEVLNSDSTACVCDASRGFKGTVGACTCSAEGWAPDMGNNNKCTNYKMLCSQPVSGVIDSEIFRVQGTWENNACSCPENSSLGADGMCLCAYGMTWANYSCAPNGNLDISGLSDQDKCLGKIPYTNPFAVPYAVGTWNGSSCSCPANSILTTVGTCQCINDYVVHSDGQCKASTPSAPVCNGYGQEMDSDAKSCVCKVGWIENNDGGCTCDTQKGFEDKGNGCECMHGSFLSGNQCVCDFDNGFANYKTYGGALNCQCNEAEGFSADGDGNCVCDSANGYSNKNGACTCTDSTAWEHDNKCWHAGTWCATNPKFAKTQSGFTNISVKAVDQNINLCAVESQTATGSVCDSSKACYYQFYIGADGACDTIANATESPDLGAGWCYCNDGYEWDGKECSNSEERICKDNSSIATWNGSACVCKDTTKVFQNGDCVCDDDYIDQNGTCIEPSYYCNNALGGSWYDGASICVYTNANGETKQLLFANDDCYANHTASKYTDGKVQYGTWCVCEEKYAFQSGMCKPVSNQSNVDVPFGNLTYNSNNASGKTHHQSNITFLNFTPATIDYLYTMYGAGWHYAGHRFLGWSTKSDATEPSSMFTFDIGTASKNTLYAVWQTCSGNTYKTEDDLAADPCAECPAGTEVNSNHSACVSICKGTNVTWVDGSCKCSAFNKVYNDKCVCNSDDHWVDGSAAGNVNGCVCANGFTLSEDKCVELECDQTAGWTDGWKLPINDPNRTNACVCDSNRNYVLNSVTETCGCDIDYPYEYGSSADGIKKCYDAAGFCTAVNGTLDTETGNTLCKISGVQYMMKAGNLLGGPTCPTGTTNANPDGVFYGDNIALCKCPYEWTYDTEAGWKCIDPATLCPAGSEYDDDAKVCKCDTTLYEETPVDGACVCKWETYNGICSTPSQVCEAEGGTWTPDDDDADEFGFCALGGITYYQSTKTLNFCSNRNATLVGVTLDPEDHPVGAGMWCKCDTSTNPRLSGEWGKDASGNYVCVEKTCKANEILNDSGVCNCDENRNYGYSLGVGCACDSDHPYEYDGDADGALECHSMTEYCEYSGGTKDEDDNYCNKDGTNYLLLTETSSCPTNAGAFDSDTLAKWCICSGQYEWVESNGEITCETHSTACDGVEGETEVDGTGFCYCTGANAGDSIIESNGSKKCTTLEKICTESGGSYQILNNACSIESLVGTTMKYYHIDSATCQNSTGMKDYTHDPNLALVTGAPNWGKWCYCPSDKTYNSLTKICA